MMGFIKRKVVEMKKIKEWKNKLLLTVLYAGVLLICWEIGMPCIFQRILSIPCPGCGMSRAVLAAMRLKIGEAFLWHPMFWSMPVLYFYFLYDVRDMKFKRIHYSILIIIGVGFVVNWVIKLIR